MMSIWEAIFLGALQGLTEFLPVSSSGHLVMAQQLLPGFHQPGVAFDVLLHVATMVAVVLYFRHEIGKLIVAPFRRGADYQIYRRLLLLIVLASVPTAVIGLTFKDFLTGLFEQPIVTAVMLLVTGTILYAAERIKTAERTGRMIDKLTVSDALVVGTIQGLAIVPGISRSGSTIATLLFKGVDGETAARFSFLLALPAVGGATLLSLGDMAQLNSAAIPACLLGMATSFVTGLLAIHWLLAVVRKKRLFAFAVYCWIIGGTFLVISLI